MKIDYCHRCLTSKCKGIMTDPSNEYGRYAYWCKDDDHLRGKGWRANSCKHLKNGNE